MAASIAPTSVPRRRGYDARSDCSRGNWSTWSARCGPTAVSGDTLSRDTSTRRARSTPSGGWGAHWLTFGFPPALAALFIRKGSVAVDGISLTVANLRESQFDVMIVPFTWQSTNLSSLRVGDRVNLECDMMGKYVARAVETIRTSRPDTQRPAASVVESDGAKSAGPVPIVRRRPASAGSDECGSWKPA